MNRPVPRTICEEIRTKEQSNRRKIFIYLNQTANLSASGLSERV